MFIWISYFIDTMKLDQIRHLCTHPCTCHLPELLASYELEDFADLRPDKIDSFALGTVIYELLMCKQLQDLSTDQTLAQCISDAGMETAMTLSHMMLPWLPPNNSSASLPYVGHTHELKNLVMKFLEPNLNERLVKCKKV